MHGCWNGNGIYCHLYPHTSNQSKHTHTTYNRGGRGVGGQDWRTECNNILYHFLSYLLNCYDMLGEIKRPRGDGVVQWLALGRGFDSWTGLSLCVQVCPCSPHFSPASPTPKSRLRLTGHSKLPVGVSVKGRLSFMCPCNEQPTRPGSTLTIGR